MNERIKQLKHEAYQFANSNCGDEFGGVDEMKRRSKFEEKFAELIVRECLDIAKNWEDELENANMLSESNAAGIVAYRIARQFEVEE
jgi:hypothetical protein